MDTLKSKPTLLEAVLEVFKSIAYILFLPIFIWILYEDYKQEEFKRRYEAGEIDDNGKEIKKRVC